MATEIQEIDRKSVLVALGIINNNLILSKVNTDPSDPIYNIQSIDNKINMKINLEDKSVNSYDSLKQLLEYCYDNSTYTREKIEDDYDLIENAYKYCNAIILDINKEGEELGIDFNDDSGEVKITPTQFQIFTKIILLDKIIKEVYTHNDEAYSTLICARFIAESVQQASVFINANDLLDYISVVYSFSQLAPCHEDEAMLNLATNVINSLSSAS